MNGGSGAALLVRDTKRVANKAGGAFAAADALLKEFRARLPSAIRGIDEAAGADDREALWQAVHWLQGAAATCSLPALCDALAEINRIARSGEKAAVSDARPSVHGEAN
jgi:HPt (histidine-containing phosphotransfer) domain-containing protein